MDFQVIDESLFRLWSARVSPLLLLDPLRNYTHVVLPVRALVVNEVLQALPRFVVDGLGACSSEIGQPFSCNHFSISRWPSMAASSVASSSQGHPFSCIHMSISRLPYITAVANESASHPGHPCSCNHLSDFEVADFSSDSSYAPRPKGTHVHVTTSAYPVDLLRQQRTRVTVPWTTVCSQILQNMHVPFLSSSRTRTLIPLATFLPEMLDQF